MVGCAVANSTGKQQDLPDRCSTSTKTVVSYNVLTMLHTSTEFPARVCFDSCPPSSLCKDCVLERLLASNYFQPLKSLWLRVLGQNPLPSRALRLQDRLPRACPHLLGDPLSKNYLRGHIIVRHYRLTFCNRTSIDNTSKTSRTSSN